MAATRTLEAVGVFEDGHLSLSAYVPGFPPDQLCLDGFEERLDRCIIIAITLSAHRRFEPVLTSGLLVIVRTVLTATVCVMGAAFWWFAEGYGHLQRLDYQITLYPVRDRPTDHAAGMPVKDHGQIQPAFARPNIGNFTGPFLVWLIR